MHRPILILCCAVLSIVHVGCGGGSSSPPPPPPTLSLTITAPTSGATVSGTVNVSATLSTGARSVRFEVDGTNAGNPTVVSGTVVTLALDTTTLSNGSHLLTAAATNASGQTSPSNSVNFNINNAPLPPIVSITSPIAGAIVGGVTTIQANVGAGINVQFQIDGNNIGTPVASPFSYPLQTTQFPNGTHSLFAVATNSSDVSATSLSVSIQIINLGQFRMSFCPFNGGNDWMADINFSQMSSSPSANSQSTLVYQFPLLTQGCQTYQSGGFPSAIGPPVNGTISGETGSGSFTLAFNNQQLGPLYITGLCFDTNHLTPSYCTGPETGPLSGEKGSVGGYRMAPFSGTFSGTLSYTTGSKTVQVTLSQDMNYVISASYTVTTGSHTLSGQVVGGTFTLPSGFDGNNNTGVEICTGPPEWRTLLQYIRDLDVRCKLAALRHTQTKLTNFPTTLSDVSTKPECPPKK